MKGGYSGFSYDKRPNIFCTCKIFFLKDII